MSWETWLIIWKTWMITWETWLILWETWLAQLVTKIETWLIIWEPWRAQLSGITCSHVWHVSFMFWLAGDVVTGIYTNKSCHTYEWVMSHIWVSHSKQVNESCHISVGIKSQIWMNYVTNSHICTAKTAQNVFTRMHMNQLYHTHECVMSHIWVSYGTRMNE